MERIPLVEARVDRIVRVWMRIQERLSEDVVKEVVRGPARPGLYSPIHGGLKVNQAKLLTDHGKSVAVR